jgi:hypothetical protein
MPQGYVVWAGIFVQIFISFSILSFFHAMEMVTQEAPE